MGEVDEEASRRREWEEEARTIFEAIRPYADRALQSLAAGKSDKFGVKSGNVRVPGNKGRGSVYFLITAKAFNGSVVDIDIHNYFAGGRVVKYFREWYADGFGYLVEESYGVKRCRLHDLGTVCRCKKERDPERTIVYIKVE